VRVLFLSGREYWTWQAGIGGARHRSGQGLGFRRGQSRVFGAAGRDLRLRWLRRRLFGFRRRRTRLLRSGTPGSADLMERDHGSRRTSRHPFHRTTATATRILRSLNAHKRFSGYLYFTQAFGIEATISFVTPHVMLMSCSCGLRAHRIGTPSAARYREPNRAAIRSGRYIGPILALSPLLRFRCSGWREAPFDYGERAVRVPACLTVRKVCKNGGFGVGFFESLIRLS
jgi:hypothetical protein